MSIVVEAANLQELRRYADLAIDGNGQSTRILPLQDLASLLVDEIVGDIRVDVQFDRPSRLAMRGQLDDAHHFNAHALRRLDQPMTPAVRAFVVRCSFERGLNS